MTSKTGTFTFSRDVNQGLSQNEERAAYRQVWNTGSMREVNKISTDLRVSSQHFQDKSITEMAKVVDNFSQFKVIEATKGIDTVVQDQITAGERMAQANRLQNEANRIIQEQAKPLRMSNAEMRAILNQNTRHKHYHPSQNFPLPGSNWC